MPKKQNPKKEMPKIVLKSKPVKSEIKKIVRKERPTERKQIQFQQTQEAPSQFKKIALEELMNKDSISGDLGQGRKWIRVGGGEKKEEKEGAIYDLAKMNNGSSYQMSDDYAGASGGDYGMAASQPGTFVDPGQQQSGGVGGGGTFNPTTNQAQSYDTSSEKNLKKERDRRGGMW